MVEDGKNKGDFAAWKAPKDDGAPDDHLSEPVQFFNVPDVAPAPLNDDDKTPVVKMSRSNPVAQMDRAAIAERLRNDRANAAKYRHEINKSEAENQDREDIYRAVEEGDTDLIQGLLNREFGTKEFPSLGAFRLELEEFISGMEEYSVSIDISSGKTEEKVGKEVDFVMRPRIAGQAPFVEIKLRNKSGLGSSRDKRMTAVISAEEQKQILPESRSEKDSGGAGGWLRRLNPFKKN
jgi:hypothetical protein